MILASMGNAVTASATPTNRPETVSDTSGASAPVRSPTTAMSATPSTIGTTSPAADTSPADRATPRSRSTRKSQPTWNMNATSPICPTT